VQRFTILKPFQSQLQQGGFMRIRRFLAVTSLAGGLGVLAAAPAAASHAWGNYHWARTSNPFTVNVIDANTSNWDGHLNVALADWDQSSVMTVVKQAGAAEKRCRPVAGKAKSCNGNYGNNGWLGLAQIWVSASHITQAIAKMNDTYFSTPTYNVSYKRQHVMCQEIGHDWGLGHQDESGADLNTCMDYARSLDNEHPNAHDYDQLETIYSHVDSTSTLASSASGPNPGLAGNENASPVAVERVDRIAASTITERYRDGTQKVTHVFWALDAHADAHKHDH
jgi:hypothetical protein